MGGEIAPCDERATTCVMATSPTNQAGIKCPIKTDIYERKNTNRNADKFWIFAELRPRVFVSGLSDKGQRRSSVIQNRDPLNEASNACANGDNMNQADELNTKFKVEDST